MVIVVVLCMIQLWAIACDEAEESIISVLTTQLGHDDFRVRERAMHQLVEFVRERPEFKAQVLEQLKSIVQDEDPDVSFRVRRMIETLNPPVKSTAPPAASTRISTGAVPALVWITICRAPEAPNLAITVRRDVRDSSMRKKERKDQASPASKRASATSPRLI